MIYLKSHQPIDRRHQKAGHKADMLHQKPQDIQMHIENYKMLLCQKKSSVPYADQLNLRLSHVSQRITQKNRIFPFRSLVIQISNLRPMQGIFGKMLFVKIYVPNILIFRIHASITVPVSFTFRQLKIAQGVLFYRFSIRIVHTYSLPSKNPSSRSNKIANKNKIIIIVIIAPFLILPHSFE